MPMIRSIFQNLRTVCAGMLVLLAITAPAVHGQTLQEVLSHTLATNPEIQADLHRRRSTDHALQAAQAGYRPTLDVRAGYGKEISDNQTTGKDLRLWRNEFNITGRQMLFDGWRTQGEVERAEAGIAQAGHTLADTTRGIMLRVLEVYLDRLRTGDIQRLAADNMALHERIAGQIRSRQRNGVAGRANVDQVEGRQARARSDLIDAEFSVADANARFMRVTGLQPEDLQPVPEADCEGLPKTMQEALTIAYQRHPGLQAALAAHRVAMGEERVAMAALMPELHAEASATKDNDIDGIDNINEDMLLMLRARYNLLNGGRDQARIREVRHLTDEAKSRVERIRRNIEEQVRLSWHTLQALLEREPLLNERQTSLTSTEQAYSQQFNIGQRSLLDLLDVGSELFAASAEHAEAWYDLQLAGYRLLANLGMLREALGIQPAAESVEPFDTVSHEH